MNRERESESVTWRRQREKAVLLEGNHHVSNIAVMSQLLFGVLFFRLSTLVDPCS